MSFPFTRVVVKDAGSVKHAPSLRLWRTILRHVKFLPPDVQSYYKAYARQHFLSHTEEADEERIEQIVEGGERSFRWVLQKYNVQERPPPK
eukprot:tig00020537_g10262.t1